MVRKPRQQLMSMRANIALTTCVLLGIIGAAQGWASVTPGESSKGTSDDQERQIAATKTITRDAIKQYNLKLTLAVAITYGPKAFDNEGGYENVSEKIFTSLGNALAPDTLSTRGR
jgi:hypothetical protein